MSIFIQPGKTEFTPNHFLLLALNKLKIDLQAEDWRNNKNLVNGVCFYLTQNGASAANFCRIAMLWPKHSGNMGFPVPCTTNTDYPVFWAERAYYANKRSRFMWKDSKYSELRMELVNFVIQYCEDHLDEK